MPFITRSVDGKSEVQVRAVLAGVFSLAIIGGFFTDKISSEVFMSIATMIITYYFTKRNVDENNTKNT